MKIIIDKQLKAPNPLFGPLRVLLSEHEDDPGQYILDLARGGLSDRTLTPEEVRELGQILLDSQRFVTPLRPEKGKTDQLSTIEFTREK